MKLVLGFVVLMLVAASYGTSNELQVLYDHYYPALYVFGGVKAPKLSHTYMVALTYGFPTRHFLCGGSLISQRTVLTAAHCIRGAYKNGGLMSSLRGTVGTLHWNEGGTSYSFSRNITYPHNVRATIKNDLGLLITRRDVELSYYVSILPMNFDFQGADVPVTIAGWGRTFIGGAASEYLLAINSTIIDGNRCVEDSKASSKALKMRVPPVEPDIEICAFHKAETGICNGDSGSPLVRVEDGQQVGIVSWGFPCARGAPDIFVRLSAFKDWVQQNMV